MGSSVKVKAKCNASIVLCLGLDDIPQLSQLILDGGEHVCQGLGRWRIIFELCLLLNIIQNVVSLGVPSVAASPPTHPDPRLTLPPILAEQSRCKGSAGDLRHALQQPTISSYQLHAMRGRLDVLSAGPTSCRVLCLY